MNGYNVVFEGTGSPKSNYKGIRTWTTYRSKSDFDTRRAESDNENIIVAEGVTNEEAIRLVSQTSGRARARAAHAAVEREGTPLEMGLMMATMAVTEEGTTAEFLDELRIIRSEMIASLRQQLNEIRTELEMDTLY